MQKCKNTTSNVSTSEQQTALEAIGIEMQIQIQLQKYTNSKIQMKKYKCKKYK